MSPEHKVIDLLQHLWPYIAGMFAAIVAGLRIWWSDRKALRLRVQNVEKIAEHAVTEARLQECKVDVDSVDKEILVEIRAIREDMREDNQINAVAHQKIIESAAKSNGELMQAILHLHK